MATGSGDMFQCAAAPHFGDIVNGKAHRMGCILDSLTPASSLSNFPNKLGVERLRKFEIFSCVFDILAVSAPFKILRPIVAFDAVNMVDVIPGTSRSGNECLRYDSMNIGSLDSALVAQREAKVTVVFKRLAYIPKFSFDSAKARNLVIWKTGDLFQSSFMATQ